MKTQKSKLLLYLVLCCSVVFTLGLLSGCKGDTGSMGLTGSTGATGPAGANATSSTLEACLGCHSAGAFAAINTVHSGVVPKADYTATIDSVVTNVSGTGVSFTINFTVTPYVPLLGSANPTNANQLAYLRFAIAKLEPPAAAGEPTKWTSYNQSERTPSRLQDAGTGLYTYNTATYDTGTIGYNANATTRVGMQISGQGVIVPQPKNVTLDFVPAGGALPTSRDIVRTANCDECHDTNGVLAHGSRYETTYCVVCHTLETKRNGYTVEFQNLIHKIHTSQTTSALDASEVTYPQDIRNCVKCHKGGTESDNWKTVPYMNACQSCHATVSFVSPPPAGMTLHSGGPQADNSGCSGCHVGTGNSADIAVAHVPVAPPDPNSTYNGGTNANTNAAWLAAQGVVPAGAFQFAYDIKSVATTSINGYNRPVIVFKLKDITAGLPGTDVVFSTPTGTTDLHILPNFVGSPSVYFAWSVPQDGITAPADFNATTNSYIRNIWNGSTPTTTATMTGPDVSGYYTITLRKIIIPSNARMLTGAVGYSYSLSSAQPLTQTNLAAYPYDTTTKIGGLIVPAADVWKVANGYTGRRVIVDTAKCNKCHDGLGTVPTFHAGQRNDAPTCSFCHNPNRTSSGWSANASSFVHGIHGASARGVAFTWAAASPTDTFADVTFPGELSNCLKCHVDGGFDFSNAVYTANNGAQSIGNMLFSTVATGILASSSTSSYTFSPYVQLDTDYGSGFSFDTATGTTRPAAGTTLVTSPITAVCSSCHDSVLARDHMTGNGGTFYGTRSNSIK